MWQHLSAIPGLPDEMETGQSQDAKGWLARPGEKDSLKQRAKGRLAPRNAHTGTYTHKRERQRQTERQRHTNTHRREKDKDRQTGWRFERERKESKKSNHHLNVSLPWSCWE